MGAQGLAGAGSHKSAKARAARRGAARPPGDRAVPPSHAIPLWMGAQGLSRVGRSDQRIARGGQCPQLEEGAIARLVRGLLMTDAVEKVFLHC